MWGIFVGIGLGVLQCFLLRKMVHMITGNGTNAAMGVLISIGSLALILVTIFLMAWFAGVDTVPWCGGGIAIGLVGCAVILNIRDSKKRKAEQREEKAE